MHVEAMCRYDRVQLGCVRGSVDRVSDSRRRFSRIKTGDLELALASRRVSSAGRLCVFQSVAERACLIGKSVYIQKVGDNKS